MAIENGPFIVDLPINSMVIFHSYVLSGGWRAPAAVDLLKLLLHRAVDAAAPESAQRPRGRVQLGGPSTRRT